MARKMTKTKIEDLPVLEELEVEEAEGVVGGPIDAFLKLGDIDGESKDAIIVRDRDAWLKTL